MDKVLTIAIPAYNMENYISRCLESVLLPEINDILEIIMVNDGSQDNTLLVAQEYVKHNKNLRIIDKPNGGWGSAINEAIKEASGKYFKILDSDDWFDSKELIKFMSLLIDLDVDLIATSFSYEYDNNQSKNESFSTELCNKIILFKEYLNINNLNKELPMASLTFKTQILKENNIHVCDRYYADVEYSLIPLIYVNQIYFSQINIYKYYIGREGQSTSIIGYSSHIDDYLIMCKKLIAFYTKNKNVINNNVKYFFLKRSYRIVKFSYYLLMSPTFNNDKINNTAIKELDNFINKNSPELYRLTNNVKVKRIIPYVYIWRKTGINLLKLRKWI